MTYVSTGTLPIFTFSGAEAFGDITIDRYGLPDCHFMCAGITENDVIRCWVIDGKFLTVSG
ncbi:hypothetical protein ACLB1T_02035 [Escherichia coli]